MQFLCNAEDINDDSSKGFTLEEQSVFAVKKDGIIHVFKNQCPHLNIELEWQPDQFLDSENYFIQCATHGALFDADSGECVSGPCLGQRLQKLESKLDDNRLLVRIPS